MNKQIQDNEMKGDFVFPKEWALFGLGLGVETVRRPRLLKRSRNKGRTMQRECLKMHGLAVGMALLLAMPLLCGAEPAGTQPGRTDAVGTSTESKSNNKENKMQDNKTQDDFAFPKTWAVFAAPDPDFATMTAVPAELGAAGKARRVSFDADHRLDLGALCGGKAEGKTAYWEGRWRGYW